MSKHLKRLNAPRTLRLHRKEVTWTVRPSPGPHLLEKSIPLGLIVRDYLELVDTLGEAKTVIANGEILVDGIKRKSHKFPFRIVKTSFTGNCDINQAAGIIKLVFVGFGKRIGYNS